MVYYYRNTSAIYKVWALQCASTTNQVEQSMNAIADYVRTNISAQRLDAYLMIESRRDIVSAGGLEAIVKGMIDYPKNMAVQVAGCRALANLSHRGGYESKDYFHQSSNKRRLYIARCGGVDTILKALNASYMYPVDSYYDNPGNKNKHTTSRGNTDLQEHACRALWALSFSPKVKKEIVKKRGEYSVRTVIAKTSSNKNDPRPNVELWARLALDNLVVAAATSYSSSSSSRSGRRLGVLVAILVVLSGAGLAIYYADRSTFSQQHLIPSVPLVVHNDTDLVCHSTDGLDLVP